MRCDRCQDHKKSSRRNISRDKDCLRRNQLPAAFYNYSISFGFYPYLKQLHKAFGMVAGADRLFDPGFTCGIKTGKQDC